MLETSFCFVLCSPALREEEGLSNKVLPERIKSAGENIKQGKDVILIKR